MSALVCWADPGGGGTCGGRVLWRLEAGAWWGRCERCNAGTTAAAGEARELGRLAEEGVDVGAAEVVPSPRVPELAGESAAGDGGGDAGSNPVGAQKDGGPRSDEHAARATGPGRKLGRSGNVTTPRARASTRGRR